jgi:rod shape-determining protein MreC
LLVVVLVSVSLAIITLDYKQGPNGPLASVGDAVRTGMEPLQTAVTSITRPIGDFLSGLAHLPSLQRENEDLKQQLADAQTQINRIAIQQFQAQALRDLLGLRAALDPDGVGAIVIGNGVSNFDWTITIDRGAEDGLAAGMPVVTGTAEAPRAVGRVIDVSRGSADVELIIDPRSAVASILGDAREGGLVWGQGDDDLRMDGIVPGTEIHGNEQVWTQGYAIAGQRSVFPPDVLIGEVSRVTPESNSLQTSVLVRPAVDFSTLEYVIVLKSERHA